MYAQSLARTAAGAEAEVIKATGSQLENHTQDILNSYKSTHQKTAEMHLKQRLEQKE